MNKSPVLASDPFYYWQVYCRYNLGQYQDSKDPMAEFGSKNEHWRPQDIVLSYRWHCFRFYKPVSR